MKSTLLNSLVILAMLSGMIVVFMTSIQRLDARNATKIVHSNVEVGEPEIQIIPHAECIQEIAQLPSSSLYQTNDPRLKSDRLIVVLKRDRRLMLFQDGSIRHDRAGGEPDCWKIALGVNRQGRSTGAFDKRREGDRRTPEGWFRTSDKPWSSFFHAILIHYPSVRHAQEAHKAHRIDKTTLNRIERAQTNDKVPPQDTPLGGSILIHGGGSSQDWTWGCIALNDHDLEEIRALLPNGMKTWMLILP